MSELLDLKEKTLALFDIENVSEIPGSMFDAAISCDEDKMDAFIELSGGTDIDFVQKIFQYYLADRSDLKQDFTPPTIGDLIHALIGEGACLDLCAGSGSLTIKQWTYCRQRQFVCIEKDVSAFNVLCFNIAIRNMDAIAVLGDALTLETEKAYKFTPREKYSAVETMDGYDMFRMSFDVGVSNPPYNIKWALPDFAPMQDRFMFGVPPKSNANLAFALTLINSCQRCALVLPNGFLSSSSKEEVGIRKNLVQSNYLDSVIQLPDGMFESTSIPVCIAVFDKNKKTATVEFIDVRGLKSEEVREQRGQHGGSSHTGRVYSKTMSVLDQKTIDKIAAYCKDRQNEVGVCSQATIEDIKENEYNISPARYVEASIEESKHRSFFDIACDINRCAEQKNICKLTINETLAKSIGLYDVKEIHDQDREIVKAMNESMGFLGLEFQHSDYIRTTKNKNELTFSNNSKTAVSNILLLILQQWKARIHFLNDEQNRYLAELRDALLPGIMSGEIEIPCSVVDDEVSA